MRCVGNALAYRCVRRRNREARTGDYTNIGANILLAALVQIYAALLRCYRVAWTMPAPPYYWRRRQESDAA